MKFYILSRILEFLNNFFNNKTIKKNIKIIIINNIYYKKLLVNFGYNKYF